MIKNLIYKLKDFWLNFRWSDWVGYIDGWIPKLSLSVPLIGYLILFNDAIWGSLEFVKLTNDCIQFGLTGSQRLRFVYFGLIGLGVSNFIYRITKPKAFTLGTNETGYTRTGLELFTLYDFINLKGEINSKGHVTIGGKHYSNEWDKFLADAKINWGNAINTHGSLLRGILQDSFARRDTEKRGWLCLCITLSTIGYLLLMAPSIDLFIKVIFSTFLQSALQ